VTILEDAKIGRPGPGVVPVAVDPRFTLPIRVERVDPDGSADFTPGQQTVLGIHSPSRTFPGGIAKGQRVRLRLHYRQLDAGSRRYYHLERIRKPADR
jgi:hypothetical protein